MDDHRPIQDIVAELRSHPDCVVAMVFTDGDVRHESEGNLNGGDFDAQARANLTADFNYRAWSIVLDEVEAMGKLGIERDDNDPGSARIASVR